jgi:tetratricopeptide (TPR) repeat protein
VNLVLSTAHMAGELDRWEEALETIQTALALNPACAPLQARAASLYERLGHLDQAFEAYSLAARLAPEVAAHHLEVGRLALQVNQADEATHYLEKAIKAVSLPQEGSRQVEGDRQADRTRREAYGLLGDAYLALGRQDEALQVYQHAATLEPGNVAHRLRLGRLYRQHGVPDQAMAHLEVALSLAPDDVDVIEEMMTLCEEQREIRKALQLCQRLIELYATCPPHSQASSSESGSPPAKTGEQAQAEACFYAGMLHKQLKEYPEALEMFRQATRLSPNHAEASKQILVVKAMGFLSAK